LPKSESNETKPNYGETKDLSSLTILQLLSMLRPAQVWAILGVIVAVLSGAFGLGYNLKSLVSEVEVVRYKTENAGFQERIELIELAADAQIERYKMETTSLKEKIKQFRGVQTKERFLALYLRYLIAKDVYAANSSTVNQGAVEEARYNFHAYVEELLNRGGQKSEEIDLTGLFLGKGSGAEAWVKFGYDGSIWSLPSELGFAAAE
jgi:hypothetical protein